MQLPSLSSEQWLISIAAVFTIGLFAVAVYQPEVFDPDPDWDVSDGSWGGWITETGGYPNTTILT